MLGYPVRHRVTPIESLDGRGLGHECVAECAVDSLARQHDVEKRLGVLAAGDV